MTTLTTTRRRVEARHLIRGARYRTRQRQAETERRQRGANLRPALAIGRVGLGVPVRVRGTRRDSREAVRLGTGFGCPYLERTQLFLGHWIERLRVRLRLSVQSGSNTSPRTRSGSRGVETLNRVLVAWLLLSLGSISRGRVCLQVRKLVGTLPHSKSCIRRTSPTSFRFLVEQFWKQRSELLSLSLLLVLHLLANNSKLSPCY